MNEKRLAVIRRVIAIGLTTRPTDLSDRKPGEFTIAEYAKRLQITPGAAQRNLDRRVKKGKVRKRIAQRQYSNTKAYFFSWIEET